MWNGKFYKSYSEGCLVFSAFYQLCKKQYMPAGKSISILTKNTGDF